MAPKSNKKSETKGAPAKAMCGVPGPFKPKRPLTAYNFFFQESRAKILGIDPPTYQTTTTGPRMKRKHRKTHGRIGFKDLSLQISQKWKDLDDEKREVYKKKHASDKARYKGEMKLYNARVYAAGQAMLEEDLSSEEERSEKRSPSPAVSDNSMASSLTASTTRSPDQKPQVHVISENPHSDANALLGLRGDGTDTSISAKETPDRQLPRFVSDRELEETRLQSPVPTKPHAMSGSQVIYTHQTQNGASVQPTLVSPPVAYHRQTMTMQAPRTYACTEPVSYVDVNGNVLPAGTRFVYPDGSVAPAHSMQSVRAVYPSQHVQFVKPQEHAGTHTAPLRRQSLKGPQLVYGNVPQEGQSGEMWGGRSAVGSPPSGFSLNRAMMSSGHSLHANPEMEHGSMPVAPATFMDGATRSTNQPMMYAVKLVPVYQDSFGTVTHGNYDGR